MSGQLGADPLDALDDAVCERLPIQVSQGAPKQLERKTRHQPATPALATLQWIAKTSDFQVITAVFRCTRPAHRRPHALRGPFAVAWTERESHRSVHCRLDPNRTATRMRNSHASDYGESHRVDPRISHRMDSIDGIALRCREHNWYATRRNFSEDRQPDTAGAFPRISSAAARKPRTARCGSSPIPQVAHPAPLLRGLLPRSVNPMAAHK
jgi:hypothetical protein